MIRINKFVLSRIFARLSKILNCKIAAQDKKTTQRIVSACNSRRINTFLVKDYCIDFWIEKHYLYLKIFHRNYSFKQYKISIFRIIG